MRVEDLEHPLGAEAAGDALAARLVLGEVQEVLARSTMHVRLVHDDHAAGAHDGAGLRRATRSRRAVSRSWAGMQPPEGPPSLDGLECRPSRDAAADVEDHWRSVEPIGTSTRPLLTILPASEKALVPLLVSRAERGVPVGAPCRRSGHVGTGLDVVDDGRLAPQARDGREGRPRARHAALALDRGDQRRLLAADEGAGALLDLEPEGEAGAEDVARRAARAPRACARAMRRRLTASGYSARSRRSPRAAPIA